MLGSIRQYNSPLIKSLLLYFIILLPIIIRIINGDNTRIHQDELITAYFSSKYDLKSTNFFSAIPQDKGEWVSQFSTPFFFLQKLFLLLFGESITSVRLSTMPYVLIVSLMLFLITKRIFNEKTAAISIILYSFFAISLYHETLSLHFVSSTAVFMTFFYFTLKNFKENNIFYSVISGITCALSYLFYSSSYIALPILLIIFLIQFLKEKKISVIKNFGISLLSFLIVIGPFLTYAYKNNFYFTQRINQVSLLNGEWSTTKERIKKGESPQKIIRDNLFLSVQSLYKNGIGGHGGYDFGRLALFEKSSWYLFLLGLIVWAVFVIRKIELLLVLAVIIISFITGVVLTIPPPAYHRFSLAFPFLVIIMSLPFYKLLKITKKHKNIGYILIAVILIIYTISNQKYFQKSILSEKNNENIKLSSYISENFPKRKIYVASFPGFALEKILFFTPLGRSEQIKTGYHKEFLDDFNKKEKYVYIIIFPDAFNEKFKEKDKNGRIINFSNNYSLFVN